MTARRKSLAFVAGSLFAATLASGCAENDEALIFLHVPDWPNANEGTPSCGVDPTSDTYSPRGTLDVLFESPYDMPGILLNNLAPGNPQISSNGIDDSEIQLVDAEVKLAMPQDETIIDDIEAQDEALVDFAVNYSTNSIVAGERHAVLVEAVPSATSAALASAIIGRHCGGDALNCGNFKIELLATVVFNAKRHASSGRASQIASRPFTHPVDICVGCLRSCESCTDRLCPSGDIPAWVGGVCDNAQDALLYPSSCGLPSDNSG